MTQKKPEFQPLSSKHHLRHGWKVCNDLGFARDNILIPIVFDEADVISLNLPFAFVRSAESSDQIIPVVVAGIDLGENILIDKAGHWRFPYIPSLFRGYPFALVNIPLSEQPRMALCFDRSSDLYRESPSTEKGEQNFFSEDGGLNPKLEKLIRFLGDRSISQQKALKAASALWNANVLTPWDLSKVFGVGRAYPKIYCIDLEAIKGLSAEALYTLNQVEALHIAYAQITSMLHIASLKRLHSQWLQEKAASEALLYPVEDALSFDWLSPS